QGDLVPPQRHRRAGPPLPAGRGQAPRQPRRAAPRRRDPGPPLKKSSRPCRSAWAPFVASTGPTQETPMRFMMLMIPKGYEDAKPGTMPDAKAVEAMMKYNEALKAAGVLLALDGLHPPSMGA